ncbi:hypothetical protein GCM10023086_30580 [Streptomyces venetus]|uniref:Pyrrolo-quinoline quinone repeat domain-containing protein n=1 Tax=Streptomyces venetus TaxID=1701086 RepID=A0ABP8FTQ3_9ACTN
MLTDHERRGSGMVSTSARRAWRVGCGTLLGVSLLALAVGDGGTSGRPLERPNTLEVAWSFHTPVRALDVSDLPAVLNDRMLAIPQGKTMSVVDTRDGRLLSTLRSSARTFTPGGFSDGVLLTVEQGHDMRNSVSAYDPVTGRRLWHRTPSPAARQAKGDDWLTTAPLQLDSGAVFWAGDGRLVGLAPRTGAVRWTKRIPALTACEKSEPDVPASPNAAATADRVVVLERCPGRPAELQVMDPGNGELVWKKKLGRWRESVRLSAVRDAIGVAVDDELRVFTESGEELLRRKEGRTSDLWPVGEDGGVVYLSELRYGSESDPGSVRSRTLHAVRADTGKTLWTHSQGRVGNDEPAGDVLAAEADADGGYGGDLRWSVGDARLQGPGASSLTDAAGRRSARVPWPVAGTFVGLSGQLIVVRSEERDGTRYTALRPGHRAVDEERPAALGGAGRRDWPDACRLVGARLLSELGRDFVELPVASSRTVLGVRLPHPSVCRFAGKSGSVDDVFSVTVRWVAPDPEAARTYTTSVIPWGCNPWLGRGCHTAEITQPRRGVFLYTYRVNLRQDRVAHATVVSGRYVFGVSAGNDKAAIRQLVRRVAMHLSQRGEAPAGAGR